MLRYLINYFVARTTYDAVYRHTARKTQQRAAINYQNTLARVEAEARGSYIPPIDDNMVNAGRRHALLGSSENEVEILYGPRMDEHERQNAAGAGIKGVIYRIGIFDVGVEFQNGRSVRECWVKNITALTESIEGGEMTAIMDNKAYGPSWNKLENSSQTRLWYRSDSGLIACCDWSSPIAGGCAFTIFDPRAGTPPGLPLLPQPQNNLQYSTPASPKINVPVLVLCLLGTALVLWGIVNTQLPTTADRPNPARPTVSPIDLPRAIELPKSSVALPQITSVPTETPIIPNALPLSKPHLLVAPSPAYPPAARRSRLSGSGAFRIKFAQDGRVTTVELVRTTGSQILDDAALRSLRNWRSQPGREWMTIVPITFTPPH